VARRIYVLSLALWVLGACVVLAWLGTAATDKRIARLAAFVHDLHAVRPGVFGEFALHLEFGELSLAPVRRDSLAAAIEPRRPDPSESPMLMLRS
jgi:hypothetical protein